MFFEKSGPVWETLRELDQRLAASEMPYVVIGGLALNAYQYPRQTVDVDIVLKDADFERFVAEFADKVYLRTPGLPRRFVDPKTEVAIDILIAGRLAGETARNSSVRFPDPDQGVMQGDLRTVSLARLIELKLVTWRYKDWGDVVELEPLNAFDRRVVHNALKDDPAIETHSVEVEGTDKKAILLRPKH